MPCWVWAKSGDTLNQAMSETFKAACLQMNSGVAPQANLERALELLGEAAAKGADLILLPEMVNMLTLDGKRLEAQAALEDEDLVLRALRKTAGDLGVWILIGSLVIRKGGSSGKKEARFANRSFLINDAGKIAARYDKIHMFDVDLGDGEVYRESRAYGPGQKAVLGKTPWGELGMTICYDLRFPHLYRSLAQAGARLLSIPAAFTETTGKAHWEVLLRARAIETGCFVFAPAQWGEHGAIDGPRRRTYGHSMIIDPWGQVLADGGEGEGVVCATIELSRIDDARRKMPALKHDRKFDPPS
jgi:deaminated glutathione amidase